MQNNCYMIGTIQLWEQKGQSVFLNLVMNPELLQVNQHGSQKGKLKTNENRDKLDFAKTNRDLQNKL